MADRKEYIERERISGVLPPTCPYGNEYSDGYNTCLETVKGLIREAPAADVVEVDMVAEMLYQLYSDDCPCNFSGVDEWLPEVCDLLEECPNPQGEFACWKQYIKHYGERKDDADNG